jgi:hypothetical protein
MPLAQTGHVWIWVRNPDTIVFTNNDHVHVLSRQGRPSCNAQAGPDTSGHRPPCRIIVTSALRTCPDVRGMLRPPVRGLPWRDLAIAFKENGNKAVVESIKSRPCIPGLGQGHAEKKTSP